MNAAYGFWRVLVKALREHPSTYAAVVFDAGGTTFRHEMYVEYKAHRKPMPEELTTQLPLIEQMLCALGIPVFSVAGVEADDVIGSIASRASQKGLRCLIATTDKDMAQLVSERILLLRPSGRRVDSAHQLLDPKGVEEKYGVPPDQIVDLLALVGDASDNIPGVPGVGEKTAVRLLREHRSLEGVLNAAGTVRNRRISENLKSYNAEAHLAEKLLRLRTDLDIGEIPNACQLRGIDVDGLVSFFTEVEFASVLDELGLQPLKTNNGTPTSSVRSAEYRTVLDQGGLEEMVETLRTTDRISIDLETTSLDPLEAEIVGIALSPHPYLGYYIPIAHDALGAPEQLPLASVLETLREFLEAETPEIIGQNLKFDWSILARHGVVLREIAFDTMIASHLSRPEERRHNLEQIAATVLGYEMLPYEEVAGKDGSFAAVSIDRATRYAAEDAEIVQRLYAPLRQALEEQSATRLFAEVELPLIPVLARMEQAGILLDKNVLAEQGKEVRTELQILEADLIEMAGVPFNPASPRQVAEILFERLGLPVIERTKTGPSTSARVLAELAVHHPLPGKLLAYRELKKLLTTYIDQLPKAVRAETGRIHTTFHQTSTATGRLSSSEPNLQNIPTRTELGGRIRSAFIAPPGSLLVAADYSQIELRLLAHLSEDEQLIEAFRSGIDLHRLTASHMFAIPQEQVTAQMRDAAKRINFGILYGISPYGLARELGVPQSDAKGYIDRFFTAYPKAKSFIDRMIEQATEQGYAETILGRRRPLPNLASRNVPRRNFDRRNAVNTPIQGSAADLIKLAMIHIDQRIEASEFPGKMILQIHDELIFEMEKHALDEATTMIKETMENVLPLRLPLAVKVTSGTDWSQI